MEEAAQNNFGTQGEKMTSDIWHSNRLPKLFPHLYQALKTILEKHGIGYREIPGTRDIWCRDYMPVWLADGRDDQFVNRPSYFEKYKKIASLHPAILLGGPHFRLPSGKRSSSSTAARR
jgi:hypothetical protein